MSGYRVVWRDLVDGDGDEVRASEFAIAEVCDGDGHARYGPYRSLVRKSLLVVEAEL